MNTILVYYFVMNFSLSDLHHLRSHDPVRQTKVEKWSSLPALVLKVMMKQKLYKGLSCPQYTFGRVTILSRKTRNHGRCFCLHIVLQGELFPQVATDYIHIIIPVPNIVCILFSSLLLSERFYPKWLTRTGHQKWPWYRVNVWMERVFWFG